jgi:hypothetical protein
MNTLKRHGLSIGIERVSNKFFVSLQATGKLTHEDYEIITPMIDAALAEVKSPKVKVFIDARDMEGWELRAAWDDFKLGLKHNNEFEKIAICGSKKWQRMTAKLGSWFASGEVKFFDTPENALAWLQSD